MRSTLGFVAALWLALTSPAQAQDAGTLADIRQDLAVLFIELQRLKAMSPNHLVVRLAGPMIEEEYQTTKELDSAFAQ